VRSRAKGLTQSPASARKPCGQRTSVYATSIRAGPPLHVYNREDECFHVLDGELSIRCGGQFPPGAPAPVLGRGRAAPLLLIAAPCGIEDYFHQINTASTRHADTMTESEAAPFNAGRFRGCDLRGRHPGRDRSPQNIHSARLRNTGGQRWQPHRAVACALGADRIGIRESRCTEHPIGAVSNFPGLALTRPPRCGTRRLLPARGPGFLPGPHHRPRCVGNLVWCHRIEW